MRRSLQRRGTQLPPDLNQLGRAVFDVADRTPSHRECIAKLYSYVRAEAAGQPVAELFPLVKQHLEVCDDCSEQYAALLEITLADEAGEIPIPPEPAPRKAPQPVREPSPLAAFVAQLPGLVLVRNVSFARAYAKSPKSISTDGQTKDGRLRWHITEDAKHNLAIHFGSNDLDLEGVRLRIKAGKWQREVVLTRVASDQVGGEIKLTSKDRTGAGARTPLTIELVEAP